MLGGPYIIRSSSIKGGIGKTAIAVNMATYLSMRGYKTLLVDMDVANPSVGLHLGLQEVEKGISTFLNGNGRLEDSITLYEPTGLNVLLGQPGRFHEDRLPQKHSLRLYKTFENSDYNFVIIDEMPEHFDKNIPEILQSKIAKKISEVLLITGPSETNSEALADISGKFESAGMKLRVVANMMANAGGSDSEIEKNKSPYDLIGVIDRDEAVPQSINLSVPAVIKYKDSKFSKSIARMCILYVMFYINYAAMRAKRPRITKLRA